MHNTPLPSLDQLACLINWSLFSDVCGWAYLLQMCRNYKRYARRLSGCLPVTFHLSFSQIITPKTSSSSSFGFFPSGVATVDFQSPVAPIVCTKDYVFLFSLQIYRADIFAPVLQWRHRARAHARTQNAVSHVFEVRLHVKHCYIRLSAHLTLVVSVDLFICRSINPSPLSVCWFLSALLFVLPFYIFFTFISFSVIIDILALTFTCWNKISGCINNRICKGT